MQKSDRIRIPLRPACGMIWNYTRIRLAEQIKSVAFIILYLTGFKILVLGSAPVNALQISAGFVFFIFGLTFFLEGLLLGLMPLGEQVGLQLPQRGGIMVITAFGLLLGVGSTLAEPAIAALRTAGLSVSPWDAPLLFRLLERDPQKLVLSIGAGVGVAVAFGMIRFYYGLSIKLFIYIIIPLLLAASVLSSMDAGLANILGLAWDSGAVTTGAVTVPLVLALGIGISRAVGKQKDSSGFGVVMLASAFPVLGVLILGSLLNASTPKPVSETVFFSPEYRETALRLVSSEQELRRISFQRGSETARRAFFSDEPLYQDAVRSLKNPSVRQDLLGNMPLQEWLSQRASETERALLTSETLLYNAPPEEYSRADVKKTLGIEAGLALRAVVPLSALLLIVLFLYLRDKPRRPDEMILGVLFALVGMTLLTGGIRLGLAPLGDQVGRPLPRVFRSVASEEGRIVLTSFDPDQILTAFGPDGKPGPFFYLKDSPDGVPRPVPFNPARYDPQNRRYEHIIERPPLFGPELTLAGIGLVFLFAFGMGYGSTLAEPALNALGRTVEELTVGTVKRSGIIHAVSAGVGIGLLAGVARILYEIPLIWLIVPPYVILLPLTYWSEEDFSGIAWDCGGVTTGIVTVPLILAMGLGIGRGLNVSDGFGVLAMASVYPVMAVLLYGMAVRHRQQRNFKTPEEEDQNE